MKTQIPSSENPIPELISKETYTKLMELGLLDYTGLRNYCLKRRYFALRAEGQSMFESINNLSEHYHLSFDYLRKTLGVGRVYRRKERKIL